MPIFDSHFSHFALGVSYRRDGESQKARAGSRRNSGGSRSSSLGFAMFILPLPT